MTGFEDLHLPYLALDAGFDEHCTKPCTLDRVVALVARLAGRDSEGMDDGALVG